MDMRKPTKAELDLYPHVDFTSDTEWLPEVLDDEVFLMHKSLNHQLHLVGRLLRIHLPGPIKLLKERLLVSHLEVS